MNYFTYCLSDHEFGHMCYLAKIRFTLGAATSGDSEAVEFDYIFNFIHPFHDSRVKFYGHTETTKIVPFNFVDHAHLKKWVTSCLTMQMRALAHRT